ncbi:pilus assembly protein [Cellvibrio polysaccharolyticus]|uniref:Pilus assembly protein n=1 Tax=Cellvibrio polysaccharolyticus TaxID=2082724 RepID=A0A928V6I6_9GAMM|nr:pilus assembly protein [Cellvibrio polysaccharolyticus]MBE8717557.1 pilus assembly protein [Cellvibrio polysaccharolyticus]
MSSNETLNLASLKMVQDELVATIEQSAQRLEQYTHDRSNEQLLQDCMDGIRQIRGTLNLIQLKGIDLLADELLEHISAMAADPDKANERNLDLLGSAFFVLPRYLEYCSQTSRSMAMLLIPAINDLRIARRATHLPESHFYGFEPLSPEPSGSPSAVLQSAELPELVRRLRHMYQTGLLKLLQGARVAPTLTMMIRALERLSRITEGARLQTLWQMAGLTLTVVRDQDMRISRSRKLLFSTIDREIKRFQFEGKAVAGRPVESELLREMLYILSLSRSELPEVINELKTFGAPVTRYSEKELVREMESLQGPSANTMTSMAGVLTDELRNVKNILERAAQGGPELIRETPELDEILKKVADILGMIGLTSPADALRLEMSRLNDWRQDTRVITNDDLSVFADTLLYVECAISGLGKTTLSDEKLHAINNASRDEVIASSHLAEAEMLVIEEAESGLAMVKRALAAFVESNFDKGHIRNIVGTLDTVRGGMFVLGLPRATAVAAACLQFIDECLLQNDQPASVQHLLETFADAIISLEYYLDSIKLDKQADTSVLQIAEESLQALGYAVH